MTDKCRILLLLSITGGLLGVLRNQTALTVLSLGMLIWMSATWVIFNIRLAWIWPRLKVERRINGRPQPPSTLWAGRKIDLQLNIAVRGKAKLPRYLLYRDLLPAGLLIEGGRPNGILVHDSQQAVVRYQCYLPAAGRGEWFGVHFRFQDSQGLFATERVFRERHSFRVLPAYVPTGDAKSLIKRTNSIPKQGIHQLKRSGLGAELLELTEYQPGDPPKSIAWKVSARRGQLMTRQYESEVPIRMTLFIEDGSGMRNGLPGERSLDQAIQLAASLAKAAVGLGDSVGVVSVSESQVVNQMRPAAGDRGYYQVLERLAEFSANTHGTKNSVDALPGHAMQMAVALAEERYPEFWEPRLDTASWSPLPLRPSRRRALRQRRRLATLLAELYGLSAAQQVELTHDTFSLSRYTRRWLADCGVALEARSRSPEGSSQSLTTMAEVLTKSVALAKDNEVFVLFADLMRPTADLESTAPDLVEGSEQLIQAAKVAVARHHRVVFICPLPIHSMAGSKPRTESKTLDDVGREALEIQTKCRARALTRYLRSYGATSAFLGQQKIVATVLAEAELAGSGRFTAGARK